jgi:hypothetical protein
MAVVADAEVSPRRIIRVDPDSDKFVAKDRTGRLGKVVEPDFAKIVVACQGNAEFAWTVPVAKATIPAATAPKSHAKAEDGKSIASAAKMRVSAAQPGEAA